MTHKVANLDLPTNSEINLFLIYATILQRPFRRDGQRKHKMVGIVVLSVLVGVGCAAMALLAGYGWLTTIGIYLLAGNATLLLLPVFAVLNERRERRAERERKDAISSSHR